MSARTCGQSPQRDAARATADDGSTLILTIFFAVFALTLVLVVTAASSLYLQRSRLFTLADGAALAAAESFALAAVRSTESGVHPRLTSAEIREAARDHVLTTGGDRFDSLAITRADTPDGTTARVTLSAVWRPPVLDLFLPAGVPLQVTSVARAVFSGPAP